MPECRLPMDAPVREWRDLCMVLGGDPQSFTGQLLDLIQHADPEHKARLRLAFPLHVAAWEVWLEWDHGAEGPLTPALLIPLAEAHALLGGAVKVWPDGMTWDRGRPE